jgi:hypothetical protein
MIIINPQPGQGLPKNVKPIKTPRRREISKAYLVPTISSAVPTTAPASITSKKNRSKLQKSLNRHEKRIVLQVFRIIKARRQHTRRTSPKSGRGCPSRGNAIAHRTKPGDCSTQTTDDPNSGRYARLGLDRCCIRSKIA